MNNAAFMTGWIGLGAMGYSMAGHLATAGHLTRVWNRSAATAEQFAGEFDVEVADSPAALAEGLDVIFLCVSNDDTVKSVVSQLRSGLKPGAVIVDT